MFLAGLRGRETRRKFQDHGESGGDLHVRPHISRGEGTHTHTHTLTSVSLHRLPLLQELPGPGSCSLGQHRQQDHGEDPGGHQAAAPLRHGRRAAAHLLPHEEGPNVPETLSRLSRFQTASKLELCLLVFFQDSYPRYLKSELYKNMLARAIVPPETKKR